MAKALGITQNGVSRLETRCRRPSSPWVANCHLWLNSRTVRQLFYPALPITIWAQTHKSITSALFKVHFIESNVLDSVFSTLRVVVPASAVGRILKW
jgi:hypothetical protein